jgi:glycosyltransferase involved in cell wall biosynthesis
MKPKIVIGLNSAWNIYNFRAGLIRALNATGYEVVAAAPTDPYAQLVRDLGCRFIPFPMDTHGKNPGRDLILLWRYYRLFKRERPDIFLGYTVKPNVYGSIAAHVLGIPVINNIAGLGVVFTKDNWLAHLVRGLYRAALSVSAKVFFQNHDDRALFIEHSLVRQEITDRLPGSGINLKQFQHVPLPAQAKFRFLLLARMLPEKGVGEYIEAARLLKQRGYLVDVCLIGFLDDRNPAAISRQQMEEWVAEGIVSYLGVTDAVADEIAAADCIVLPSFYPEGVPRALLEAAAMGRPIITTDTVGCREMVDDGVNGYLVKPRDSGDLAAKMMQMMELSSNARSFMGQKSREKAELEFDEQIVIEKYIDAIAAAIANS